MAGGFDWKTLGSGVKTRTDLGVFLLFSGVAALGDAVWNFAPHGEFYAIAPWAGAVGLGLKKLVFDRRMPDSLALPRSSSADETASSN
ncbi:hypothetical protein [Chthonobacter albigriseus]|uniref:hypothetical protein n=1 Tax=Chthonobacter albigriseus TaxID=1683161 RepID=UPI0015EEF90B|nr:hypothetical protein [Chthonobacter albigriseus]